MQLYSAMSLYTTNLAYEYLAFRGISDQNLVPVENLNKNTELSYNIGIL